MRWQENRRVLWRNISALMKHHWGKENLNRLAREAKFSPNTAMLMKRCETSIGIDTLAEAARVFRLQPWQLLDPRMDPKTAEMRALGFEEAGTPIAWPFLTLTLAEYALLPDDERTMVEGFARGLLSKRMPNQPD